MATPLPFFFFFFFFFFFLLISSSSSSTTTQNPKSFIGVTIGTQLSSLLTPPALVTFLKSQQITHIRLYDAKIPLLSALNGSGISVLLGIPNNQLLALASSNDTAAQWVNRHVSPFPTLVSAVSLGDEVPSSLPSALPLLVPALYSLHSLLSSLNPPVPISTPLPFSIILDPFPPSQAFFNTTLAKTFVSPLLGFLSNTSSPLMLNLYPYYSFMQSRGVIPLDNALFKPLPPSREMVDPNTMLHYSNVFDAMLDAAYSAMRSLNVTDVTVLATETGWPSLGSGVEKPYATKDNADTYNSNLIKHVLDRSGTPLHPEITSSVYIYELFNEDLMPGSVSEKNWGLFYGNGSAVYLLRIQGSEGFLANDTTNRTFCVTGNGADEKELQAALDWACGPGRVNCSEIQPGEACYDPNDISSHASYAFDSYYQMEGKSSGSCYFQGAAMLTTTDPSHGDCIFPGSKEISNISVQGGTNSSASSGAEGIHSWWKQPRGSEENLLNLLPFFLSMMVVISVSDCNVWGWHWHIL